MPLIVRSPYSGQPVKVRDQDLGRAIRDEEGRIFYVVPRSEGQGYYAAPTRKGSEKDEQRYLDLERKVAEQGEVAKAVQQQSLHDATGPGRPVSPVRLIVLVLILLAAIAAAVLFLLPPELSPFAPVTPPPTPEQPAEPEPGAARPSIAPGGPRKSPGFPTATLHVCDAHGVRTLPFRAELWSEWHFQTRIGCRNDGAAMTLPL